MSKEMIVKKLIDEGKSTREDLRDAAECTAGSLASYLSAFRNAAKFTGAAICPIEIDVDGAKVFVFKTFDEVEQLKAERTPAKAKTAAKTPQERLDAATKRVIRTDKAMEATAGRAQADPDNRELDLRYQKASIEAQLAELDLAKVTEAMPDEEPETTDADAAATMDAAAELM